MGEIKSVKVDNWGVFFLQKLQNFFNKTDYCDLTLQFRDNSQLKVHRLVLSACTDYFNVLEQTCEMLDDALIMPNELQADVVVPIVNFMYTGTLEFELKMYGKLLRTAKDMNMTVLLKLLEAHRRTMEGVNRMQRPPSPKPLRRRVPVAGNLPSQQPVVQQRRILTSPNSVSGVQRRIAQTKSISTNSSSSTLATSQSQYRQQIGSTSLIKANTGNNSNTGRTQFDNLSLQESHQTTIKQEPEEPSVTSPFEQLRKGYNNNKRPASNTLISPPTKKLNIEDVKEFAEQQRMRKQIAAEYGDDQGEYESGMMEDDIHNDDDDDDLATSSATATSSAMQPSTSRQTQLQHGATTITINQNEKPPTIVVKDSSNSKMNHAKIIKEVLRQYPHLVKSNKNIKLKIMPSSGDQPQKIIVKKEQLESITSNTQSQCSSTSQSVLRGQTSSQTLLKPMEKTQSNVNQTVSQQTVLPKVSPIQQKQSTTSSTLTNVNVGTATVSATPVQKRRIDSKTMHALIALGAENTTGPWLCLRCGVNGRPISIPSYRGFRRHLINTHKEHIDPALCEHCGWRSSTKRELHFHMEVEHKVKTTSYTFPQCLLCSNAFLDTNALNKHMVEAHPDENKQQCIYCNKIFARELQLYNHMKTYHKKQALEDGIIDYSDEEFSESQNTSQVIRTSDIASKEKKESKIKIISDISLPCAGTLINMEGNNVSTDINAQVGIIGEQQEFMETSESAIITSEPKFVTVDGNEMVLTDEQRQEIMAQLNQDHGGGGVVMVLNEPTEYAAETTALNDHQDNVESSSEKEQATQESNLEVGSEHEDEAMNEGIGNLAAESSPPVEDFDDSQIYRELNDTQNTHDDAEGTEDIISTTAIADDKRNTSSGSALDESKESIENLEWAENLISAHEMADQEIEAKKHVKENKDADAINQKLKELTGDWSEDENDEEQKVPAAPLSSEVEAIEESSTVVENILEEKDNPVEHNQKQTIQEDVQVVENMGNKTVEQDTADTESDIVDTAEVTDNPAYTNINVDDMKGDEDDLDMLMKNLHKEDRDVNEIEGEEKENEERKMDEGPVEDLEVATQNEDFSASSKDTITIESGNISKEMGKTDTICSTAASESSLREHRDMLLDELIIKEEFISECSSVQTKVEKISCVNTSEPSTTEEKPTESVEATEIDEDKDEDGIINEKPDNKGDGNEDSFKTVEKTVKDVAEASEANKNNVELLKTSERVNSLISEWGEDEEEDEQIPPPTAIITTEEEGTL